MTSLIPSDRGQSPASSNPPISMGRAIPAPFSSSLASSPPAAPLSKVLSVLAREALIKPRELPSSIDQAHIKEMNREYSWKIAEIGALFSAMYQHGVVTDQDRHKIDQYLGDIEKMEKELKDIDKPKARLQKMRQSLEELRLFSKELTRLQPFQEKIDHAKEALGHFRNPEKVLLAAEATQQVIDAMRQYAHEIASLPEGNARTRLQWSLEKEIGFFSLDLLDWEEDAERFMQDESQYFAKAWKDAPDKGAVAVEVKALLVQQEIVIQQKKRQHEGLKKSPELKVIAKRLSEQIGMLENEQKRLLQQWKEVEGAAWGLPTLKFGSGEWQENRQKRPVKTVGMVAKAISHLNPENWNDTTKDVVYRLLALMQLQPLSAVQFGLQTFGLGGWESKEVQMKRIADHLQREVIKAVPAEKQESIEKDASVLGRLLSEKYEAIQKKNLLESLTKRNPAIRGTLEKAIAVYGKDGPTENQIKTAMDTYRTEQMVKASPIASPLKHLSLAQWWDLFTTKEKAQQTVVNPTTAPLLGHEIVESRKEDSTLAPHTGWLSKMMSTAGSYLSPPVENNNTSFIAQKRGEGAEKLDRALALVSDVQDLQYPKELQEDARLLHQALLTTVKEAPREDCSLPELASWRQKVDDTLYGVAQLEQQIGPKSVSIIETPALTVLAEQDVNSKRLHTFLESPIAIGEKLFAHVVGHGTPSLLDAQVAGVKLEGLVHSETIAYQLQIAEDMLKAIQENPSQKDAARCCNAILGDRYTATIEDPEKLGDLIQQLRIAQSIIEPVSTGDFPLYRSRVIQNVEKLQAGQSFFIPGFWASTKSGHGIAWTALKQANGKLTVRLHNTGAGLQYHAGKLVGTDTGIKEKFLTFTEIVDVEPSKLTSNAFLQGTWNLETRKLQADTKGWSEEDVYHALLISLEGKWSTREYSAAELADPQYLGICAMESIMAAIGSVVSTETSQHLFRFWGTLKGTASYYDSVKDRLLEGAGAEERRRLLRDGLNSLARITLQTIETGTLTDQELAYTRALYKEMNQHLKAAEKKSAEKIAAQTPLIQFEILDHPVQSVNATLDYVSLETLTPITETVTSFRHIDTDVYALKSATIISDLDQSLKEIHKVNHEGHNYVEVQRAVRSLVLKIPLKGSDPAFWKGIDDAAAGKLLTSLAALSQEYLWTFLQLRERDPYLSSEDFICQSKLLALANTIVQQYQNPLDLKIPSLFQDRALAIPEKIPLRGASEWKEQEAQIEEYWHEQKPGLPHDPFLFGHYPAGGGDDKLRRFETNLDMKFYARLAQNDEYARWVYSQIPRQWLTGLDMSALPPTSDAYLMIDWVRKHPEQVKKIDPKLLSKRHEEQATALLNKIEQVPPLRDAFVISYVFDYLLTGAFGERRPTEEPSRFDFSKGIQIKAEKFEQEIEQSSYGYNGRINYETRHPAAYGISYSLFGFEGYPRLRKHEGYHLSNGQTRELGPLLSQLYTAGNVQKQLPERRRVASNDAVTLEPGANVQSDARYQELVTLDISIEQFRELLALSSKPSLQIAQTVGYFSAHPHLLLKPHFQIFFRLLMTESQLLNTWITENPQAVYEINAFYKKTLQSAEETGELNLAIFIAGMSDRLEASYREVKAKHAAKMPEPDFIQAREKLQKLASSQEVPEEQRALAYRELALTFRHQTTLTPKEASQLLQSVLYQHLHQVPSEYRRDLDVQRDVDLIVRNYFSKQLHEMLKTPKRDEILTLALRGTLSPEPAAGHWTSPKQFPLFLSPDGTYEYNVLDGTVKAVGHRLYPFMANEIGAERYGDVFGEHPPTTMTLVSEQLIELQTAAGDRYRMIGENFSEMQLQREFENGWYQLVPQELTRSLLHNQAFMNGLNAWHKPGPDEKGEILFSDQRKGNILYRGFVEQKMGSKELIIQKIVKLETEPKGAPLLLVDSTRAELEPFRRLEAAEHIVAWSRGSVLEKVELPRFGLSFTIVEEGGKRKAVSEQLSGYALIEGAKQHVAELGDVGFYLHLKRTEKGGAVSERVIIPRYPLKPHQFGAYRTETRPDRELSPQAAQHLFEYQLVKGELVPATPNEQEAIEANLYLAMVHLAERNPLDESSYARARHYLEKADSQIMRQREPLNLDTLEILQWIATLDAVTQDRHPDSTALRLKSSWMMMRNSLNHRDLAPGREANEKQRDAYQTWQKGAKDNLQRLYKEYLTHIEQVDADFHLSKSVELDILQQLGISEPRHLYRFKQLTHSVELTELDTSLKGSRPIQIVPIETTTAIEAFRPDWVEQLLQPKVPTEAGVLLRDISSQKLFQSYYAIAKGESTLNDAIQQLQNGMGLNLSPDITRKQLLEEMRLAFKIHVAANRDDWASTAILAVLTRQEAFHLTGGELSELIESLRQGKVDLKELPERIKSEETHLIQLSDQVERYRKGKESWKYGGAWPEEKHYRDLCELEKNAQASKKKMEAELKAAQKRVPELEEKLQLSIQKPTQTLLDKDQLHLQLSAASGPVSQSDRLQAEMKLAKQPKQPAEEEIDFAECINLSAAFPHSTRTLEKPILPKEALEQLLKRRPLKPAAQAIAPEELFRVNPENPQVGEIFLQAEKQLKTYIQEGKSAASEYEIVDAKKISELTDILGKNISDLQRSIEVQEIELLQLAHRGPERIGELAQRDFTVATGSHKLLTIDELVKAYFQRDYEMLHQRNPHLQKEEMTELYSKIERYLFNATHLQQETRVFKNTLQIQKAIDSKLNDAALQEHLRNFMASAQARRTYNPHEHPEYLVFEYYTDLLLWGPQIEKLDALGKKERYGALIELAMGMGKSHVIAPLLMWLMADGEQTAILVMPDPLLTTMAKDIQQKSGPAFGQQVRTFPIKREPITKERLQRIFLNLDEVRRDKIVLIWTASDIQSLFNQWVELHEQAYEKKEKGTLTTQDLEALSEKHALFLKSFNQLVQSAALTVDEIHQVFDILRSHSFTFGAADPVHIDTSRAIIHLFDAIVSTPKLHETIRWDFLAHSKGESFTEEGYNRHVKSTLIDALVEQRISPKDPDFTAFFSRMNQDELQHLKAYLADSPSTEGYKLLEGLESRMEPYRAKKIRNEFATLKESLNVVLPKTAGKKPDVQFGLNGDGSLNIPYHDGLPSVNSLFGSVLERLIYTIQYNLSKGMSKEVIRKKIEQLQEQYRAAVALGRKPDLSEFQQLTGGDKFKLLAIKTDKDFDRIAEIVNRNPAQILKLTQEFSYPQIKVYAKDIESSAHLIPLLMKPEQGVRGFAGTLFNVATFPKVFQPVQLSDTQAKTLDLIRQKSPPTVATLPSLRNMSSLNKVNKIYDLSQGAPGSLIDATGTLSGEMNEQLAKGMLEHLAPPIHGVVFYDGNVLKVVTRTDKNPIPYSRDMDPESLAALWDLSHKEGSDIPVGMFMNATMLVGKHITLGTLMQSAWRLRGLAKGQAVNFMVPAEDKIIISKMLREHLGESVDETKDLTLPQLIRFSLLNQALQEGENTYKAIKERMKMALIARLTPIVWDEKTSSKDVFQIYVDTRSLFIQENPAEAWDNWGRPTQDVPTHQALQDLLQEWKSNPILAKIQANPTLYNDMDINALVKEWETIVTAVEGPLPATVKTQSQTYGKTTEQNVEQKTEQKVEQKVERKIEQKTAIETRATPIVPRRQIPRENPFLLRESKPTPISVLSKLSEDKLPGALYWSRPIKAVISLFKPQEETGACIKANDLLRLHPVLKEKKDLFDSQLLVSANLAPVQGSKADQIPYTPFDRNQKTSTFVEVIEENSTGNLKLKLIDGDEAAEVAAHIKESHEPQEVRLGLFQLQKDSFTLDLEGSESLDLQSQEKRARFHELLIQAKFLSGMTDYKPQELPYLKAWIEKTGADTVFQLINVILNPLSREDTRKNFPQSVLAQILEEQGIPRQAIAAM